MKPFQFVPVRFFSSDRKLTTRRHSGFLEVFEEKRGHFSRATVGNRAKMESTLQSDPRSAIKTRKSGPVQVNSPVYFIPRTLVPDVFLYFSLHERAAESREAANTEK